LSRLKTKPFRLGKVLDQILKTSQELTMSKPISGELENKNSLQTKRHSFAHIMAAAVLEMFPEAKFGVGPVIENGCYYDFILPRTLIPEDLNLIEAKIKEILYRPLVFKRQEITIEEALIHFSDKNQELKVELLETLRDFGTTKLDEFGDNVFSKENTKTISLYRLVDENTGEILFEDLCKGPHIENLIELTGKKNSPNKAIGFKLDKFSGAYWRGDQKRGIDMQRIYALVFQDDERLGEFIFQREEAKKRDHRFLGEQMKLFTISPLVGAGLPLIQPNGMIIRKKLEDYLWQLHSNKGYSRVWTPHIGKIDLYETSGHAAKFGDELFRVKGKEEEFIMKPMNCPHHMQIFADNQFSYRDMPVRYFEPATVYRDEKSGQLSGLTRVRSITQDDGHLFCKIDQIGDEVKTIVGIIKEFYRVMGMINDYWVSLSVRDDSDSYIGSVEVWEKAENALEEAAKANNLPYKKIEGEAAFYGPKLDFMFKDVLGREWQLATIQCDFTLPERFDLSFINEDGEKERPVVIHRAISGSLERFMAILTEHYAGRFPFWLAPEQVRILTVNDKVLDYVKEIQQILSETVLMQPLKYNEIRVTIDERVESLGKKIREAEMDKIPVIIIIGPKDVESRVVSIRTKNEEIKIKIDEINDFLSKL
jgi:threonyl-tRNA synthetase